MRILPLLIALLLLPAALTGTRARADDGELKAEIEEMIAQRHPTDTEGWWRALGPEAPRVIIAMYQESSSMLHKLHLLQGLAAFHDDPDAVAFLKSETKSQTSVVRGTALGALGASQGDKALDTLAEGLKNEDPQTRFAAAKAIRRIGSPPANEVLNGYLKSEKVDWISKQVLAEGKEAGLKPVSAPAAGARNEDFAGSWSGFFIKPSDVEAKPGLLSLPATAQLRVSGKEHEVEGEVSLSGRRYAIKPSKLQNGRWQGKIQVTSPTRAIAAPAPAEMELTRFKKTWTLMLKIPSTAETAVFLKN